VLEKMTVHKLKPTHLNLMIQKEARLSSSCNQFRECLRKLRLASLGHMGRGRRDRKEQGT
jgi:hypothetical protein